MQNELICERIGISKQKKIFLMPPPLHWLAKKAWKKTKFCCHQHTHTPSLLLSFQVIFLHFYQFIYPIFSLFSPWMFIYTSCQIDCIPITVAFKAIVTAYLSPPFSFFVFFYCMNHFDCYLFYLHGFKTSFTQSKLIPFPLSNQTTSQHCYIFNLHQA